MQKFWPLLLLIAIGVVALVLIGLESSDKSGGTPGTGKIHTLPSGLKYEDVTIGTGPEAKVGDRVTVHYTGRLASNGKQFDSSVGRDPFSVTLGGRQVIQGWEQGIPGMKVGGKRKLMIPSHLGYGAQGTPDGTIPPNADLEFDVELLKIGK